MIEWTASERRESESLAREQTARQARACRARIVLAAAAGLENKAICFEVGADANTVGKWRRRFAEHRQDGLLDEPRPDATRKIGDDEIADTIRLTLEAKLLGATHWSLRSMASSVGYAPSTIHRIWRAFRLQPHHLARPGRRHPGQAFGDNAAFALGVVAQQSPHAGLHGDGMRASGQVCFGAGLVNLFRACAARAGRPVRLTLPWEVAAGALSGADEDCDAAVSLFFAMLETVAGNLALTLGATGGAYVTGGIARCLRDVLEGSLFRDRFMEKGRLTGYFQAIPTCLVLDTAPALLGLAKLRFAGNQG